MSRLAPLSEEPINEEEENDEHDYSKRKSSRSTWKNWIKSVVLMINLHNRSHLRVLLSVLGCPLFPLSVLHPRPSLHQVSSSAQYIIQHFTAATGCRKLEGRVKNIFATGKVTMAMGADDSVGGGTGGGVFHKGCFVMWQMVPNKWLIEMVVGAQKVVAGSDGNVAWRHTPWFGLHAAKGGVRPLRRALQMKMGFDLLRSAFEKTDVMDEKMAFLNLQWYVNVLAWIRINAFRIELACGSYEDLLSSAATTVEADDAVGTAVYILPSFCNHDCVPNAHIEWIENADARLKAIRDVDAGEELRICYIDASMGRDAGENLLAQGFGFQCNCLWCLSGD